MKHVRSSVLAVLLGAGVANALPLLDIELGGLVTADIRSVAYVNTKTTLGYGAYGRIWLKLGNFRIAPFVKYENLAWSSYNTKDRLNTLQYGGVIGYKMGIITPYVGASYQRFLSSSIADTYAVNYGLQLKFPIIPISIGVDGSWSKVGPSKINMNRIGATIGLQF